ncbi:hypothetical protein JOC78_003222 [Bacillus ectoiniformans]|uniref:hypothetical protein n=1 Tax=Bacillus ectoiniformans TaxID=1494429 RepID=UPI001956E3D1|nr:hypothetical protein [Bacillus ectoiniformans]MBM7650237.1 hypothetical protein [Bacillus ectoiniformans]
MKFYRKTIFFSFSIIAVFILIFSWIYPYSMLSIHKSYTYEPDPLVIKEYVQDIKDFKRSSQADLKKSEMTEKFMNILEMFQQHWLLSKKPVIMDEQQMEFLFAEVKESRHSLLQLLITEDFSKEERSFLIPAIEELLTLEESIVQLSLAHTASRATINLRCRNLHINFINCFHAYETFYHAQSK